MDQFQQMPSQAMTWAMEQPQHMAAGMFLGFLAGVLVLFVALMIRRKVIYDRFLPLTPSDAEVAEFRARLAAEKAARKAEKQAARARRRTRRERTA